MHAFLGLFQVRVRSVLGGVGVGSGRFFASCKGKDTGLTSLSPLCPKTTFSRCANTQPDLSSVTGGGGGKVPILFLWANTGIFLNLGMCDSNRHRTSSVASSRLGPSSFRTYCMVCWAKRYRFTQEPSWSLQGAISHLEIYSRMCIPPVTAGLSLKKCRKNSRKDSRKRSQSVFFWN